MAGFSLEGLNPDINAAVTYESLASAQDATPEKVAATFREHDNLDSVALYDNRGRPSVLVRLWDRDGRVVY